MAIPGLSLADFADDAGRRMIDWQQLEQELEEDHEVYDLALEKAANMLQQLRSLMGENA